MLRAIGSAAPPNPLTANRGCPATIEVKASSDIPGIRPKEADVFLPMTMRATEPLNLRGCCEASAPALRGTLSRNASYARRIDAAKP
jgi:hypothetical protein